MEASDDDWRYKYKTVNQKIQHLYTDDTLADVVLNVTNGKTKKTFKAHSFVLKLGSAVFEKMLDGDFKEKSHNVDIDDVDPVVFEMFLKFMYLDKFEVKTFHEAAELFKVAHRFLVKLLVNSCAAYMISNLEPSNALQAYSIAKMYNLGDLKEKACIIMINETAQFVSCEDFVDADEELVQSLLDEPELNIREAELFKSVEIWLNKHENKANLLNVIVPKFRFLSMTAAEFAEGPSMSDLLTSEEKHSILLNIVTPNGPLLLDKFPKTLREGIPNSYFLGTRNLTNILYNGELCCMTIEPDFKGAITMFFLSTCECSKISTIEYSFFGLLYEQSAKVEVAGKNYVAFKLLRPITIKPNVPLHFSFRMSHHCSYTMLQLNNVRLSENGVNLKIWGNILSVSPNYYSPIYAFCCTK